MLGADGGVVESGGDGVGARDLAGVVLEDVGVGSLEDAGEAASGLLEAGGVLAEGWCLGLRLRRRLTWTFASGRNS